MRGSKKSGRRAVGKAAQWSKKSIEKREKAVWAKERKGQDTKLKFPGRCGRKQPAWWIQNDMGMGAFF